MRSLCDGLVCAAAGLFILACPTHGAVVATYVFNNSLAAQEGGAPVLVPEGTNSFVTKNVFGNNRTVYHFDGTASPTNAQGGVTLDTAGLISGNTYSVEMVFELALQGKYSRILDTDDRTLDTGLYASPSNHFQVYNTPDGSAAFSADSFFDVFVTLDGTTPTNNVNVYVGPNLDSSSANNLMNISTHFLNFFLDNANNEWSAGDVALIRVFNTALTQQEVTNWDADPFAGTGQSAVPEPCTFAPMLLLGGAWLARKRKR